MGWAPAGRHSMHQIFCCFFAVYGGLPKAAIQYIQVWSFLLCCVWWAAEGRHSAHPGLYLPSSLCTAGGRRPPFRISRFVASFFAVHGGWPKATIQYTQVYIVLAVYGGRPKAAIQYIQVCTFLLCCARWAAKGYHWVYPALYFPFLQCTAGG